MVRFILHLLAIALASGSAGHALESPAVQVSHASVRLLAGGSTDGALRAGVAIHLDRGWHTYWRYPGDAGIPPRFDWAGSDNVAAVDVLWPAPKRIEAASGTSIGYEDEVVFPLRVRARDSSKPVKLTLRLDFAVCERICIPADARLRLEIPPAAAASPILDAWEAKVPRKMAFAAAVPSHLVLRRTGKPPQTVIEAKAGPAIAGPIQLFAEGPTDNWALPVPMPAGTKADHLRFQIDGAPPGAEPLPRFVRLTLVGGKQVIEVDAPIELIPEAP